MGVSKHIPSMYQRRLLLLMGGLCFFGALPALRMGQLTLAKGRELRDEAERKLVSREWLDNARGEIRDRKGRTLAYDRPSMDIAVEYPVITGEWSDAQAARKAKSLNRAAWAQMSAEERDQEILRHRPEFDARLDQLWATIAQVGGVTREEIEQRRATIREQVQLLATQITERKRQERERLINRDADVSDAEDFTPVSTAEVRRPVREESESHVVLHNVPDEIGFQFQKLQQLTVDPGTPSGKRVPAFPGLRVQDARRRDYPLDTVEVPIDPRWLPSPLRRSKVFSVRVEGVATHAIGWMRDKPFREDMERRPLVKPDGSVDLGHYRPGDSVGHAGVEGGAEDLLRGVRGLRVTHLDTGEVDTTPPIDGSNVQLTIDALLQARVQAIFDPAVGLCVVQPWHKTPQKDQKYKELPIGTRLNGAVVVLEIESGDVLAMVSMPSMSHQQLASDPASIPTDSFTGAFQNRAIDVGYPPGSIVKPLIYSAAVSSGKFGLSDHLSCTGHFYPDKPLLYRCWIYKQRNITHDDQLGHNLSGSDAIKVSCNIFFFELGRRLGPEGVRGWYNKFGVGAEAEAWNIYGLPSGPPAGGPLHEARGSLGRSGGAIEPNEAVLMGIGQGPIVWTPLHAADAYATLVRQGVKRTPRLRTDVESRRSELALNAASVRNALDGLRRGANEENGTTYAVVYESGDGSKVRDRVFNLPGVDVWGKSGTADAPPFVADLSVADEADTYDGDHAWCVCLAGVGGVPRYVVAVVIEHGGSGGRVAGPVANQVLHALASEGYLPDVRESAGSPEQPGSGGAH